MLKVQNIWLKSIAIVILIGVLITMCCSFYCSLNLKNCGSKTLETHDCCSKLDESKSSSASQRGDCQTQHLTFLFSIGQFFETIHVDVVKPLNFEFIFVVFNTEHLKFNSFEPIPYFQIYPGYNRPPAKQGIPVLFSSLLI